MTWAMRMMLPAKTLCEQREQAVETFKNLREQIPLLYAVALVNLIGMHTATGGAEFHWLSPLSLLSGLLVWRMFYWLIFQKISDDLKTIERELIKVVAFAMLFSIGFSVWAQVLMTERPEKSMTILLYSVLAALGAAYGLGSFPRAAMLPLIFLALPVAVRLLTMGSSSNAAIGYSLILTLLLFMRLLRGHSQAQSDLVSSRMAVARENNRAISAEVAALKRAEEDALTGLANRGKLVAEVERNWAQGASLEGRRSVIAIIDLDGFKAANDAFGHAAGDAILKTFAERLLHVFGEEALVARMGGDEFAILWRHGLSEGALRKNASKICELAAMPIEWDRKNLTVSASCGLSEAEVSLISSGEFLRQADSALYNAKASGRGLWRLHDQALFEKDQRRATLEKLLLGEAPHDEMAVQFQPIVCAKNHKTIYAEALARWSNPLLGSISPSEFIQISEQLGTIYRLNDTLLKKAIRETTDWPEDLRLSFNLSALQICHAGAATELLNLVSSTHLPPSRIMFEVTETAFLADLGIAKNEMKALQEAGCLIALDDFGAGYASVSYLRELAFDLVKFDGALVENIQFCDRARGVLLGLINLCHAAHAKCVAEHVENLEQLTLLNAMGCDYIQGFYFGEPSSSGSLLGATDKVDLLPQPSRDQVA